MANGDENNGLCTSTWGAPGWFFLHCVAAGYPVDPDGYDEARGNAKGHSRRAYTSFFTNMGNVLPCRFCRESYIRFVSEIPIEDYTGSRSALFEWLFIVHNKVNHKLGRPVEPSLGEVVDKYERFRAKCHHDKSSLGCTEPAEENVRMRCRLVIEPAVQTGVNSKGATVLLSVVVSLVLVFGLIRHLLHLY